MTEMRETEYARNIIDCDNFQIDVADPQATCEMIRETEFDIKLVKAVYGNRVPPISFATIGFNPSTEDEPAYMESHIEYLAANLLHSKALLRELYGLLRENYFEEEHVTYSKSARCPKIFIHMPHGSTAIVEVTRLTHESAFLSVRIDIEDEDGFDVSFLHDCLETWGTIQNVITQLSDEPSLSVDKPVVIELANPDDISSPSSASHDLWQSLLTYDLQARIESSRIPMIDYPSINIEGLAEMYPFVTDALVSTALAKIAKRKLVEQKNDGPQQLITQLDLSLALNSLRPKITDQPAQP